MMRLVDCDNDSSISSVAAVDDVESSSGGYDNDSIVRAVSNDPTAAAAEVRFAVVADFSSSEEQHQFARCGSPARSTPSTTRRSDSSLEMIEATEEEDPDGGVVVVATVMREASARSFFQRKFLHGLICVGIVATSMISLVVMIVLFVGTDQPSRAAGITTAPNTTSGTTAGDDKDHFEEFGNDAASYYLRALRFQLLGVDAFRLESGAAQLRATEWMAFTDEPRLNLDETLHVAQRYAMLVLYFEFGLDTFPTAGVHECAWQGVFCDDSQEVITGLDWGEKSEGGLAGRLAEEIALLSSLRYLDLRFNRLEGSLPTGLYALSDLVYLDLSRNEFAGHLDAAIGGLSNLEFFSVWNNYLSGSLPISLRSLSNLKLFDIESNMFTGDGWSFLPAWGQIEEFYLPNNLITATIPTEIGRLTTLRILEMSGTETSGTIPTEIGNLAMLTSFSSDQSDLQGSIPTEIGRLTNLENFFLRGAQLQGTTIPTEIGQCTNLAFIQLSYSFLEGTLQSEIGALTKLTALLLGHNYFKGTIPQEWNQLTSLEVLKLFGNGPISGSVPHEMCDTAPLIMLDVGPTCSCCIHPE